MKSLARARQNQTAPVRSDPSPLVALLLGMPMESTTNVPVYAHPRTGRLTINVGHSMEAGQVLSDRPFEYGGDALTASDAHRLEAITPATTDQFTSQVGEDSTAGRADRMAKRNS